MQVSLIDILWMVLIILGIFGLVALFQLILILFDVRQIVKTLKKGVLALSLFDWCFDGEEFKRFVKKMRNAIFNFFEFIFDSLIGLFKGGEKSG
ncbi:MAG: hypothetical protein ACPL4K_05035 [Candidatus Margulisiibacteriota bacterium]